MRAYCLVCSCICSLCLSHCDTTACLLGQEKKFLALIICRSIFEALKKRSDPAILQEKKEKTQEIRCLEISTFYAKKSVLVTKKN